MKIILIAVILIASFSPINAQLVTNVDDKDSIALTEEYKDYSDIFTTAEFIGGTKKYIDGLLRIAMSENCSSEKEATFYHELYVLKDGTVRLLSFRLSGDDLKMTKEQADNIKKKLTIYIQNNKIRLKAKENWHETGMARIPPLKKKRSYKDYVKPNPAPTEPETTKMGLIQRLGNQCTETWQNEGTDNPMDLKFLGLINVAFFTFDEGNPLFSQLKKLCPKESVDALRGQIYDYIYEKTPVYKAKYGYFEPHPDYKKLFPNHCDCVEKETAKMTGPIGDRIYDAADTCKMRIINTDAFRDYVSTKRDEIVEQAEKDNVSGKIAAGVYLSGFDGSLSFDCPFIQKEWKKGFVDKIRTDSIVDLHWSVARRNLSTIPILMLADDNIDALKSRFSNEADFSKNRTELTNISKELIKNQDFTPALIGQRRSKDAYIEEIVIFNKSLSKPFFEVRMHYEKKGATDKLIRIQYIPLALVDMSRRTFNDAKKTLGQ
jgi:hypothetical protein